jgi:hypothetical protein
MAIAVIALPIACITLIAGPADAATPAATGSLSCAVGGSVAFSPQLSFNGTVGSKEVVTFNLDISGCTSSDSSPSPAPTSATTTTKTIKLKGTACQGTDPTKADYDASCSTKGKPLMTGSCSGFSSNLSKVTLKSKEDWNTHIKPTKGSIGDLATNTSRYPPYIGSTGTGSATGSYAGMVSTSTFYTAASSSALVACEGGSETPVTSLTIDSSISTISDG